MNVLIVKTHRTNGRAWAAWKITEEKAKGLEYVLSVMRDSVTAYRVEDFVSGYFFDNEYKRVVFDLTELTGAEAQQVIDSLRIYSKLDGCLSLESSNHFFLAGGLRAPFLFTKH